MPYLISLRVTVNNKNIVTKRIQYGLKLINPYLRTLHNMLLKYTCFSHHFPLSNEIVDFMQNCNSTSLKRFIDSLYATNYTTLNSTTKIIC